MDPLSKFQEEIVMKIIIKKSKIGFIFFMQKKKKIKKKYIYMFLTGSMRFI